MTPEQVKDFENWHIKRMAELNYPPEVKAELTKARRDWISRMMRNEDRRQRKNGRS